MRWIRRLAVGIVAVGVTVGLSAPPAQAQPTGSAATIGAKAAPQRKAASYSLTKGPNRTKYVVLSYDDCPRSLSAFKKTVLAAEKLNIALVLFPTGNCWRAGKFRIHFARAHGHYVFSHTVSHPDLRRVSSARIRRELGRPAVQGAYVRPPYGAYNSRVLRAIRSKGMQAWLWTVDTNDWRGRSRSAVVNHVVRYSRPGGTVLMHMQHQGFNATALKQMKERLQARGISVCRNYPGKAPSRPKTFRC